VIISDGIWQRRFGGDRTIIGRQVTLDDNAYTVIGVMPRVFENVVSPSAELWAPLQYDLSLGTAWGHHLRTMGRLRPGVSVDHATREIDALGQRVLREQQPETYGRHIKFVTASLQDEVTRSVKPGLIAVLGAVALLLVIACVNVINLLLARGAQRRTEFAVRAALGAGRTRLIQQIVTESLLLALLGGAVGLAVAPLGIEALKALGPGLPRAGAIRVDGTVFAFALSITTLIGLVVGVVPALHTARDELWDDLKQSCRRAASGPQVLRRALVVAQWPSPSFCWSEPDCSCAACKTCSRSPPDSTPPTCSRCRCTLRVADSPRKRTIGFLRKLSKRRVAFRVSLGRASRVSYL
jgi:hypothetical protein